jgi:hypothetical protein
VLDTRVTSLAAIPTAEMSCVASGRSQSPELIAELAAKDAPIATLTALRGCGGVLHPVSAVLRCRCCRPNVLGGVGCRGRRIHATRAASLIRWFVPSVPALVMFVARNARISGHHAVTVMARRTTSGVCAGGAGAPGVNRRESIGDVGADPTAFRGGE